MIEISQQLIKDLIPKRPQDSHKGTFGSVLTITSSAKYSGAGYLCAKAASIAGCGYSTIATPKNLFNIYRGLDPEILVTPLSESSSGNLCYESIDDIDLDKYNVITIGGGIDTKSETIEFIKGFFRKNHNSKKPFIIDADAINCLSKLPKIKLPTNSLLTPHQQEFERLLKLNPNKNQLLDACKEMKTTILLKGHRTKISDGNEIWQNTTGCSALAKAGSGDVLTGTIAGFCAQGVNLTQAALIGIYIHGLASELYAKDENEYSMTMKNLLNYIPKAITLSIK